MSDGTVQLLSTAMVCGAVVFVICFIAGCVNSDTLVRAYQRWRGESPPSPCTRCQGTGHEPRQEGGW